MRWLVAVALAAALGWQWFPSSPEHFLQNDSGVWVHVAKRMLEGARPYADVWDHKPPGILWIHVAALGAAGGQLWGAWLAAVASLAVGLWMSAKLAAERFGGAVPGWLAMAWAWVCFVEWLDHVDYTEVFVLPMQAALLWLALRERHGKGWTRWEALLAGGVTACTILLRPNLAGTGLVVLAFAGPRAWLMSAAGCAGVLSVAAAAAWSGGWLAPMIDAVWRFNLDYSKWSYGSRMMIAAGMALGLTIRGVGVAAPIGLWITRKRPVAWTLAAAAAVEYVSALISGKGFGHYFVPVAVPLSILGSAAWAWAGEAKPRRAAVCGLALLPLAAAALPLFAVSVEKRASSLRTTEALAAADVRRLSTPADRILMWDGHQWSQSLSGRREATRHFFWVKLYVLKGWQKDIFEELNSALHTGSVDFVVEGSRQYNPFPPIPRTDRPGRPGHPELNHLADWIEDHFEVAARGKDYRVWRRRAN